MKRVDQKTVVLHNLSALKENAKVKLSLNKAWSRLAASQSLLRNGGEAIVDKRSTFLFLIMDFVPNYVWIGHRADVRWNCLKPDQIVNRCKSSQNLRAHCILLSPLDFPASPSPQKMA